MTFSIACMSCLTFIRLLASDQSGGRPMIFQGCFESFGGGVALFLKPVSKCHKYCLNTGHLFFGMKVASFLSASNLAFYNRCIPGWNTFPFSCFYFGPDY